MWILLPKLSKKRLKFMFFLLLHSCKKSHKRWSGSTKDIWWLGFIARVRNQFFSSTSSCFQVPHSSSLEHFKNLPVLENSVIRYHEVSAAQDPPSWYFSEKLGGVLRWPTLILRTFIPSFMWFFTKVILISDFYFVLNPTGSISSYNYLKN